MSKEYEPIMMSLVADNLHSSSELVYMINALLNHAEKNGSKTVIKACKFVLDELENPE